MAARASSGIAAALSTSSPASQGSCVFSACTNGTGVSSPEARAPEGGSIKRTRKPSFGMLTKTKTSSKLMRDHEWKDEVDKMRAVLDEQKKRYKEQARYLVNPDSRAMAFWDATTTAALAYTALITPVEVSVLAHHEPVPLLPTPPRVRATRMCPHTPLVCSCARLPFSARGAVPTVLQTIRPSSSTRGSSSIAPSTSSSLSTSSSSSSSWYARSQCARRRPRLVTAMVDLIRALSTPPRVSHVPHSSRRSRIPTPAPSPRTASRATSSSPPCSQRATSTCAPCRTRPAITSPPRLGQYMWRTTGGSSSGTSSPCGFRSTYARSSPLRWTSSTSAPSPPQLALRKARPPRPRARRYAHGRERASCMHPQLSCISRASPVQLPCIVHASPSGKVEACMLPIRYTTASWCDLANAARNRPF